jgi:hypothetical protein
MIGDRRSGSSSVGYPDLQAQTLKFESLSETLLELDKIQLP